MRIIVMGTGPFAVPTAQELLDAGHDIALVVTRPVPNPDAPPKKQPSRPVYTWAMEHGLPIFEPSSINTAEAIATLQSYSADLFFVCDYGQILSNQCLSAARLGGINLHGSLLPRHRGAAPVQWALLRGDAVSGVTVIHMTPRLDAGPALAIRSTPILPDETSAELEPRLAELGVAATSEAIGLLQSWDGEATLGLVQDQTLVTKAPRFSKADGQLDFRLPAEYLVRLFRACQPWPGSFGELAWPSGKNLRVQVKAARWLAASQPSSPGCEGIARVVDAQQLQLDWSAPYRTMIAVESGEGLFLIARLQPAGKREMDAEEFLRGHPLDASGGCRFALPAEPRPQLDER